MMKHILLLLIAAALVFNVPARSQDQPATGNPAASTSPEGRRFQGVAGTITSISSDSIELKTSDGKVVQVNINSETRFRKERKDAKPTDFKVGDTVFVRGEPAGDNKWTARAVISRPAGQEGFREGLGKRFIAGEIKSIDGANITVLRIDGETQAITADENTSFRKDGQSVTLADFKTGDHVFGRGEMKNGVFVPAVLNLGDPREMRMQRGPGEGPQH